MNNDNKQQLYESVIQNIQAIIKGETDLISIMATVVCELHHQFSYFDWTGFYRVVTPGLLKVGPYQGTHGCLQITFNKGVCGAAARTRQTQLVPDVSKIQDHIACSISTQSEIVIPLIDKHNNLIAVLDVDSNSLNAFDSVDQAKLEQICRIISECMP